MVTTAIISLRETFETALILCVLLSYFARTREDRAIFWMWLGTGAGIVWSVALAILLMMLSSYFTESFGEAYEGFMMIAATILLSWMILWMSKNGRSLKKNLEQEVEKHLSTGYLLGVATTSFLATAREGTELVILTHAAMLQSGEVLTGLLGSGIGIVVAIGLGWMLFRGSAKLPMRLFFILTSALLIVIALMLLEHGLHELMEAHLLPENGMITFVVVTLWGLILGGYWLRLLRH
jgi:high-affinity iron transporter